MEITRSIDIEAAVREALSGYMAAYCPPLPGSFTLPCVRVSCAGGTESDTIDTWTVVVEGYAEREAEACEVARNAVGILKQVAKEQSTEIRAVVENVKPQLFQDPVRPDLARYRATLIITTHQEKHTFQEVT